MKTTHAAKHACALAVAILMATIGAQAQTATLLYSFSGANDGGNPNGGLVADNAGNLYGTALFGGSFNVNFCSLGCGVVFELSPSSNGNWSLTVLHTFTGAADGGAPSGGLVIDGAGDLFGMTMQGGATGSQGPCGLPGCGVVFELVPSDGRWLEKVIHVFVYGHDGAYPSGSLVLDKAGNLYGTTPLGGGNEQICEGCGIVFELSPTASGRWRESILHTFMGGNEGSRPTGGLALDSAGNLYGTTSEGGIVTGNCLLGCGVAFRLTPTSSGWKETILHEFTGGPDGLEPDTPLVVDGSGNVYGTAQGGGKSSGVCYVGLDNLFGCGVAFKLSQTSNSEWTETVLHTFSGGADGGVPVGGLTPDGSGVFFGALEGGPYCCNGGVFRISELDGDWKDRMFYTFGVGDLGEPVGNPMLDSAGNLFGSTFGGTSWGSIFQIAP